MDSKFYTDLKNDFLKINLKVKVAIVSKVDLYCECILCM